MYIEYFGLKELPFNITSDPNFLYLSKNHKEAISHMLYGIKEKKGFVEITGEIGTGKTTMCRALLKSLSDDIKTAFILNPSLSNLQLLEAIVEDLGIVVKRRGRLSLMRQLNEFLLEQFRLHHNTALIVDEAQNLTQGALEQIRLLSNLETEKEKLLQIILVGQPELRDKLALPELRQLQQRISVRYHIMPLNKDEVKEYISHRLKVAGFNGEFCFAPESMESICGFSKGIPRLINILCDRSLLACYALEKNTVDTETVSQCIDELNELTL